jgi:tRNA (guanine-N7-)-methyltransferase
MPRKKLYRLSTVKDLPHVLEYTSVYKGHWQEVFDNDNSLTLELGCGRGELSLGLAELFPEKNFIGIDKKADRLWFGGKGIEEMKLQNIRFLRLPIERIVECFAPNEVNEIWITFPDPFLRRRDEKRRLLSPRFLDLYRQILKANATIHLKTDSEAFFEYSLDLLSKQHVQPQKIIKDIYKQDISNVDPVLFIQTTYEKRHLAQGKKIYYLQFKM